MATADSPVPSPIPPNGLCDECSQSADDHFLVALLGVGAKESYTVPSFPVFSAMLREVKFQFIDEVECYDGYIRDCPALDRPYPTMLKLCFGYSNAFSVDPEEFQLCIPLAHNKTLYEERVFIMWKWSWESGDDIQSSQDARLSDDTVDDEDGTAGNDGENFDCSLVTHSVTFKCMGASKTLRSQEVLAESANKLKKSEPVEVRLRREPTNPKDARAIAFDCKHNDSWEVIGYVVRDALDSMHHAIENRHIISVQFDWIRFITHWSHSGPGWYCGIKITKKGEWSKEVLRCRSTF